MLYKYTFPTTKRSGLIRTGGSTWFKIEDEPVKIEIGCIAEGVAYMLAIFYVFNMKYPVLLNGVNLFFEKIMGLSPSLRLSVSIDLNILK